MCRRTLAWLWQSRKTGMALRSGQMSGVSRKRTSGQQLLSLLGYSVLETHFSLVLLVPFPCHPESSVQGLLEVVPVGLNLCRQSGPMKLLVYKFNLYLTKGISTVFLRRTPGKGNYAEMLKMNVSSLPLLADTNMSS